MRLSWMLFFSLRVIYALLLFQLNYTSWNRSTKIHFWYAWFFLIQTTKKNISFIVYITSLLNFLSYVFIDASINLLNFTDTHLTVFLYPLLNMSPVLTCCYPPWLILSLSIVDFCIQLSYGWPIKSWYKIFFMCFSL